MGKILFPKCFPTCPTDGSDYVIPGYTAAITSNLEETMKMFWRPRKIKVSGSYSQFNDATRDCNISASFELIIKSQYGSEEEMVCEPVLPWALESSTNVEDPENAFNWDSKPYYYGDPINSFFTFNSFDFSLNQVGTPGGSGCLYKVFIRQFYLVEREDVGPFDYKSINIAGVDFNMATYFNDYYQSGYVTASVEVLEWWSFGGTYNTETGNPL